MFPITLDMGRNRARMNIKIVSELCTSIIWFYVISGEGKALSFEPFIKELRNYVNS